MASAVMLERIDRVVRRKVNESGVKHIINGLGVGLSVMFAGALLFKPQVTIPAIGALVATYALAAGIASGVSSFIRG